jgi:hypothetical protein
MRDCVGDIPITPSRPHDLANESNQSDRRGSRSAAESRRCAGAPLREMEMREALRAAAKLEIRPVRPKSERWRRSMLVGPHRGGEVPSTERQTQVVTNVTFAVPVTS